MKLYELFNVEDVMASQRARWRYDEYLTASDVMPADADTATESPTPIDGLTGGRSRTRGPNSNSRGFLPGDFRNASAIDCDHDGGRIYDGYSVQCYDCGRILHESH